MQHQHGDFFSGIINKASSNLYRTIIDLNSQKIRHILLDDRIVEFPTINENQQTQRHQFIYAHDPCGIIKWDVCKQKSDRYAFHPSTQLSEVVFVARENAQAEDDGYLMLFVYDFVTKTSEFFILVANDFNHPPLARVQMPCRIPRGFHGSWVDDIYSKKCFIPSAQGKTVT